MLRFKHYVSSRLDRDNGADLVALLAEAGEELSPRSLTGVLNNHSNHAILAYDDKKLVAAFAYDIDSEDACTRVLFARGTLVAYAYRGQGLGTEMWCRALRKYRARKASVYVVSIKAIRMLRQVEARMPNVKIKVSFGENLCNRYCRKKNAHLVSSHHALRWKRDHKEAG